MVQITVDDKVRVRSPYHPEFSPAAKNLGGKWDASNKIWTFDPRDEDSVRDLCKDLFGTDGEDEVETVDVRVALSGRQSQCIWFAGRAIARRPARDWAVKLGQNVVLVDGEFASSGGSRKNPMITLRSDEVVLEVRDVPLSLAKREQESNPEFVTILDDVQETTMDKLRELLPDLSEATIVEMALSYYLLHVEQVKKVIT